VAAIADIQQAVGCLSQVFPQFVAKQLATLTDQIASAIQGFTDPLAAIGDQHLDSLLGNAAASSASDTFGSLTSVAAGLASQYTQRDLSDMLSAMSSDSAGVTKRIQQISALGSSLATTVGNAMSLYPDVPYAAAQRMCTTMIQAIDLKTSNLTCLRKHIVQLVNAMLIVIKMSPTYTSGSFADLMNANTLLEQAQAALLVTQRLQAGVVTFDSNAFERARQALLQAGAILTPPTSGPTIMDVADVLGFGSVDPATVQASDIKLTMLAIPSLLNIIEAEASAIVSQVQVINFYVQQLNTVVPNFRTAGQGTQAQNTRARAVASIQGKLNDLVGRIELAITLGDLSAASTQTLAWTSRIKAIVTLMDQVKQVTLQEGSIEGPTKAAELAAELATLLGALTTIANEVTIAGVENPLPLQNQVLALTAGARRLMSDVGAGRINPSRLATFHQLASSTALSQTSRIDQSAMVAAQQRVTCARFAAIPMQFAQSYGQLIDGMRQLGLDRGVDMLNAGSFQSFLDSDPTLLSYLGTAIACLTHGIAGTDDDQTKQQIAAIRDDLIGQQTNLNIAAVDASDQGRLRFITQAQDQIANIQKNAKTIESIVTDLQGALAAAGGALDTSLAGLSQYNALLGNIDQLAVGAGGRLASTLESTSAQPNAGVVACDTP
jgi:hypothetical protein